MRFNGNINGVTYDNLFDFVSDLVQSDEVVSDSTLKLLLENLTDDEIEYLPVCDAVTKNLSAERRNRLEIISQVQYSYEFNDPDEHTCSGCTGSCGCKCSQNDYDKAVLENDLHDAWVEFLTNILNGSRGR